MSIASIERPTLLDRFRFSKRRELAHAALAETVETETTSYKVPTEVITRMEEIRSMPVEEIDRQVRDLVTLSREAASMSDSQEIPKILTDAVHDTAELMANKWATEDYTMSATAALVEAFAISHDDMLIVKAAEVVDANPSFADKVPDLINAIEFAKEHPDEIDATFNPLEHRGAKSYIPMPIRQGERANVIKREPFSEPVPMETYEYLFSSTNKRVPRKTGHYTDIRQKPL